MKNKNKYKFELNCINVFKAESKKEGIMIKI